MMGFLVSEDDFGFVRAASLPVFPGDSAIQASPPSGAGSPGNSSREEGDVGKIGRS